MSSAYLKSQDSNIPSNVAENFITDDGTAIPVNHDLNVLGGSGITTYASPDLSDNLYIKIKNSQTDVGTTVNVETITLSTLNLTADGTYFFTSQISGYEASGKAVGAQLFATAVRQGGVVTIIGDTDNVSHKSPEFSGVGSTVNYMLTNSGGNVLLNVTGEDGYTIYWGAFTVYVYRGSV